MTIDFVNFKSYFFSPIYTILYYSTVIVHCSLIQRSRSSWGSSSIQIIVNSETIIKLKCLAFSQVWDSFASTVKRGFVSSGGPKDCLTWYRPSRWRICWVLLELFCLYMKRLFWNVCKVKLRSCFLICNNELRTSHSSLV